MPEPVTRPEPLPDLGTLRLKPALVLIAKVAVTLCAWLMLTVQVIPEQVAPLQPLKVLPGSAVAVSVTLLPLAKYVLQREPQLRPNGSLTTLPEPVPDLVTLSVL